MYIVEIVLKLNMSYKTKILPQIYFVVDELDAALMRRFYLYSIKTLSNIF